VQLLLENQPGVALPGNGTFKGRNALLQRRSRVENAALIRRISLRIRGWRRLHGKSARCESRSKTEDDRKRNPVHRSALSSGSATDSLDSRRWSWFPAGYSA
jgi:hypothetical protein